MSFPASVLAQTAGWLGLAWADWAVLALYFVVILVVGIYSARKVHDIADFFMGGRRFGKIFMMFFAFGSGTSSEQAISVVAGSWRVGLAGIWWQFLWLWATPFYWIVAPVMRRMRALTTADFFEARYNTSTATLYSLYGIIMAIVFIAGGLYSSGKMVNALTGGQLDDMARANVILVPEVKWDAYDMRFGRGVLFETNSEYATELDAGTLPEDLQRQFADINHDLGDDVAIEASDANDIWNINDQTHGLTYMVRRVLVTERDGDGGRIEVEKLRIHGCGYRRLQGYEFAIAAMTLLFVIYGMAGGLGAAIVTDFIQGVLTITFSFLLLPFVFNMIGGFGQLHSEGEIKRGMFDFVASPEVAAQLGSEPITGFYVVMLSATGLAGIVVQPHIMGVCGAGKTEFEGRFGFTVGNFLKRFCTIAWTFTGLACIVWYLGSHSPLKDSADPEVQALYAALQERSSEGYIDLDEHRREEVDGIDRQFADELFGRAAYDILPTILPGLVGLLLASLLAAVMSTSDAQMVVSSGLFTENIYKRFLIRGASPKHYLWVGRIAGLIIVALALVLQSTFTDVIDALKVIIKTPAAIGISLWFGIVWRRWTSAAVWCSTLAAAAAWAGVAYFPEAIRDSRLPLDFMFHGNKMGDAWQMAIYLGTGIIVGTVVSLITPRVAGEKLDSFYALIHTPIRPGEVVETPCTLPENPAPREEKLFNLADVEVPKPTWVDVLGFLGAWICVGLIIKLTDYLSIHL